MRFAWARSVLTTRSMVSARVSGRLWLGGLAATLLVGCFGQIESTGSAESRALAQPPGDPPASSSASDAGAGSSTSASLFLPLGYPPDTLVNDADYIYWSELNSVFRASKVAPVREKLFGDGTATTGSIAVDDAFVYGVDWQRGSLLARAKSGGAIETILPEGSGARVIAQDATNLYVGLGKGGGIRVFAKGQHASVTTLRAGQSLLQLAVSNGTVFSVEGDYMTSTTMNIARSTTSGTGADVVAVVRNPPYQLVAVNDVAYWTEDGALRSTSSTTPLYVPTAGTFLVSGLSVIGDNAYVVEMSMASRDVDGTLLRVPLGGGASSVVASLAIDSPPGALRAFGVRETNDAANIYVSAYWTNPMTAARGDAILRVPVP